MKKYLKYDIIKILIREDVFMMSKQNKQLEIAILDIDSMIPKNNLLRRIKDNMDFDFIYEKTALCYYNQKIY